MPASVIFNISSKALSRLLHTSHMLINFLRLREAFLIHVVDLGHVSLPVVFARKSFAALSGVLAIRHGTVKLLLLLVTVIDVSLEMCLGTKAFATIRIVALVILYMVTLVMSMFVC